MTYAMMTWKDDAWAVVDATVAWDKARNWFWKARKAAPATKHRVMKWTNRADKADMLCANYDPAWGVKV